MSALATAMTHGSNTSNGWLFLLAVLAWVIGAYLVFRRRP